MHHCLISLFYPANKCVRTLWRGFCVCVCMRGRRGVRGEEKTLFYDSPLLISSGDASPTAATLYTPPLTAPPPTPPQPHPTNPRHEQPIAEESAEERRERADGLSGDKVISFLGSIQYGLLAHISARRELLTWPPARARHHPSSLFQLLKATIRCSALTLSHSHTRGLQTLPFLPTA